MMDYTSLIFSTAVVCICELDGNDRVIFFAILFNFIQPFFMMSIKNEREKKTL